MDNPEAFLDLLTIRSQKERYHGSSAETATVVVRDANGLSNHEELELFVRDFAIDDSIADRFAESSGDPSTVMGVVSSPSKRQMSSTQPDSLNFPSAKTDDVITITQVEETPSLNKRQNFVASLFHRKPHQHTKDLNSSQENARPIPSKPKETQANYSEESKINSKTLKMEGKLQNRAVHKQREGCAENIKPDTPNKTKRNYNKENIPNVSNTDSVQARAVLESPCLKADEFYHERPSSKETLIVKEHGAEVRSSASDKSRDPSGQHGGDGKGSKKRSKLKQDRTKSTPSLFNLSRVLDHAFAHRKRKTGRNKGFQENHAKNESSLVARELDSKDSDERKFSSSLENMATFNETNSQRRVEIVKAEVHSCPSGTSYRSAAARSRPTSFDDATIKDVPKSSESISLLNDASFDQLYMEHAQCKLRRKNYSKSDSGLDKRGTFQKNASVDRTDKKKGDSASRPRKKCHICQGRTSLDVAKSRDSVKAGSSIMTCTGNSIDSIVNSVGDLFREHGLDKVMGSNAWYEVDSDVSICDVSRHDNRVPLKPGVGPDRALLCDIIESSLYQQGPSSSSSTSDHKGRAKTGPLKDNNNNNTSSNYNDNNRNYNHNNNSNNSPRYTHCNSNVSNNNITYKHNKSSSSGSNANTAITNGCPACSRCNPRQNGPTSTSPASSHSMSRPSGHRKIHNASDIQRGFQKPENLCPENTSHSPNTSASTETSTECDCNSSHSGSECKHYQNCSLLTKEVERVSGNCRTKNGFFRKCQSCCPWCCEWLGGQTDGHSDLVLDQTDLYVQMSRDRLLTVLSELLFKRLWSTERKLDRVTESLTQIVTCLKDYDQEFKTMSSGTCQPQMHHSHGTKLQWAEKHKTGVTEIVSSLSESLERLRWYLCQRSSYLKSGDPQCDTVVRCFLQDVHEIADTQTDRLAEKLHTLIESYIRLSQNRSESASETGVLKQISSTVLIGSEPANQEECWETHRIQNVQKVSVGIPPSRPTVLSNERRETSSNQETEKNTMNMIGSETTNGHHPFLARDSYKNSRLACHPKTSKSTNQKCSAMIFDQQADDLQLRLENMVDSGKAKDASQNSCANSVNLDHPNGVNDETKYVHSLKNHLTHNLTNSSNHPNVQTRDFHTDLVQNSGVIRTNDSRNGTGVISIDESGTNKNCEQWIKGKRRRCNDVEKNTGLKYGGQYSITGTHGPIPEVHVRKPEMIFATRDYRSATFAHSQDDDDDSDDSFDESDDDDCEDDEPVKPSRGCLDESDDESAGTALRLNRHLQAVQRLHHRNSDVMETVITADGEVLVPSNTSCDQLHVTCPAERRHAQPHSFVRR